MTPKDFLLEIGCEELPANSLLALVQQLSEKLANALAYAHLEYQHMRYFATPRRLAILLQQLSPRQPDRIIQKKGPSLKAPAGAVGGFAKSCGVEAEQLIQQENYYYFHSAESGLETESLLPDLVNQAVSQLAGIKTMRWGSRTVPFLRPVHWVVMLYGEAQIDAEILGIKTSRETYGHRFHHPAKINLLQASDYEDALLEEGFVRADIKKRREYIRQALIQEAASLQAKIIIDERLLNEVANLVEWPVILRCPFSAHFLAVPKEALVSAMQHHQKCFPVYNANEDLLPYFLAVSNLQSKNPQAVIAGNARVMKARLSDAAFFYEQDQKMPLAAYLKSLEKVVFQQKLGSVADKVKRLVYLSEKIAKKIQANPVKTQKAALLCKADLMTQMVNEFPELQGIMGYYYAKAEGEPEDVAKAIQEHYLPRFAGDSLPKSAIGCAIALADRFDTLNSIFKIGETPTGDKDPLGLRRAALGIIRIIIEKALKLMRLGEFCELPAVQDFILERLPAYYQEQHIPPDTLQAVLEVERDNLLDMHLRICALQAFRALPEAKALSESNKRVKNILKKNTLTAENIEVSLFELPAEKMLHEKINSFPAAQNYTDLLENLSLFREPLEHFFTEVMVDVADEKIKQNRLQLLTALRALFLKVGDISLLS